MTIYKKTQALICSISLLLLTAISTHAADAAFSWTANPESVSGYKIHYGTSSRNYNLVVDVGLPAPVNGRIVGSVEKLQEGQTYYFAATAYSTAGESTYSVEVVYAVPGAVIPEPPVAGNISLQGTEDTPLSGQLSVTSAEGTVLDYTVVAQPGYGTLTVEDTTGTFTYTPVPNYAGNDTFSYKASNSAGLSNLATATIVLAPANDSPVANSAAFSVSGDSSHSGTLSADDIDGDDLTYFLSTQGTKGTAAIDPNGSFTYTPNQNLSSSDSFTFRVNDGTSQSNTATVNVIITPVIVATPPDTNPATEDDTDANIEPVDTPTIEVANDFALEAGELLVTSEWQHVAFSTEFVSPSVVAKSTTKNDPETGLVTIRNLTNQGFDIRINEWDDADGLHSEEIVSFMVMERGRHQIADNVYGVAECTNVSGLNSFQPVTFANALPSKPVVIASIVTENEPNAAILRMKDITSQGFSITMQEQEYNDGNHAEETICFIAMEKWSGVVDSLMIEVGSTENGLTHQAAVMYFEQQFPAIPFVVADLQSTNGTDTALLGISNLSVTDTTMTVVEEKSADSEIAHSPEVGGYFAIAPMNPPEESADEELTIEEEPAPTTPADLSDTNQDAAIDIVVTPSPDYPADTGAINQEDPIVTETVSDQTVDERVVTSKRFNGKTMSSVKSLFGDLIEKNSDSKRFRK